MTGQGFGGAVGHEAAGGCGGGPGGDGGARAPWRPDVMLQFSPMLHQLARTFWAFKQAYAGSLTLPPAAIGILAVLAEHDGLTQQELTTILRIDPSMITRTVKELERERGWIRRARDPLDQRLMRVSLTEEGRTWAVELPRRAREIEQRLLRDLDADERATLQRLLRALEDAARRDPGDPPAGPPG